MSDYVSCYDPPLFPDIPLEEHRANTFESSDKEMFLHVGHFVAWYAALEFGITLLLHRFTGKPNHIAFHILTKGMDAKLKIERLKEALKACGWTCDLELAKRFQHFTKIHVPLRNALVHSHLYWPEGSDLQMTSVGTPPKFKNDPFKTPPPRTISGLELYERGIWLKAMAHDVMKAGTELPQPLAPEGILGRDQYLASLPTGDRPSPTTQARRARAGKPVQKSRSEQQSPKPETK